MPKTSQPVALLRKQYSDFDQFTDEVRAWDLNFKQLDRGVFLGEMIQVLAPGFQLGRAKFHRRLHQSGQSPQGLKTFVVPMNPEMTLFWRGKHLCGDDIMAFPDSGELDSVSELDFDVFTVSLPVDVVAEAAECVGRSLPRQPLLSEEARRCSAQSMRSLRRRLVALQRSLMESSDWIDGTTALTQQLAQLIATTWRKGDGNGSRQPKLSRAQIIQTSLDHIHDVTPEPVTLSELCRVTGASERTVQYCFHDRFGMSPKTYMQAYRLCSVRRDLRRADSATTRIADVANQWGFWHMGQFAADYRKQFGELPSETLSRR